MLLEANNKQELLRFLPALRFGVPNWPTQVFIKALTMSMLLADLHLKLLIPPRGAHFMTSDHPVALLTKPLLTSCATAVREAWRCVAYSLLLPLSPDLLLLAFDPVCYRVGRPDRKLIQINRQEKQKITEDGREGLLIIGHAPAIPLPGIWSFCKTRRQFVAADFVVRDPEKCRLYEDNTANTAGSAESCWG